MTGLQCTNRIWASRSRNVLFYRRRATFSDSRNRVRKFSLKLMSYARNRGIHGMPVIVKLNHNSIFHIIRHAAVNRRLSALLH